MKKFVTKQRVFSCIALAVMIFLFISSSMTYKQQTSVPFLERYLPEQPLKQWLSQFTVHYAGSTISVKSSGYFKFVEFFIRKTAHFMTYFILAGSIYMAIIDQLKSKGLSLFLAVGTATGYAATDEFHQMLTGGRTPLFQDVMLDGCGALVGVIVFMLAYLLVQRKKG